MPEPMFLVEGNMEKKFLQKVCGEKCAIGKIRNGKTITIPAMAEQIVKRIKFYKKWNCHPIVILVDLERRSGTWSEMEKDLRAEIKNLGYDPSEFKIGIADRMIENWILADHDLMNDEFKGIFDERNYDGENGKKILKNLIGEGSYKKTTRGVELLRKMNVRRASRNSESLKSFIETLDGIDCWWLSKE